MNVYVRSFFQSVLALFVREWRRVFMEPSRIVGMLLQPLVFLILFGVGFKNSFFYNQGTISYAEFFFAGILGLVVLFSAIYSTLTLVEDKNTGLFRTTVLSPVGISGAIAGKVLATTSLSFFHSILFLPLLYFLELKINAGIFVGVTFYLLIGSLCFSLAGVIMAWISPSSSAFHAMMSILLIPCWLLSGAMFPMDNWILAKIKLINPMGYLVDGLRAILLRMPLDHLANSFYLFTFLLILTAFLVWILKKKPLEF